MLLSVPLSAPFTLKNTFETVSSSFIDARRPREQATTSTASSATGISKPSCRCTSRRSIVVHASSSENAGAGRETAERRRVLLKFVREVQPALIEQFVDRGPPAVVAAMKSTITNMLGTLPPQFFTVTISTVGENLSQLMLSVLMTGYLFRNAQYRLELHSALGSVQKKNPQQQQQASAGAAAVARAMHQTATTTTTTSSSSMQRSSSAPLQGSALDEELYAPGVQKSRVHGDVLLWHKENGLETLEAVQYIELLEEEVGRLRQQLQQLEAAPQQQLHAPQQQQQQHLLPPPRQQQPGGSSSGSGGSMAPGAAAAAGRPLPVPVSGQGSSLQQQPPSSPAALHSAAGVLALHEEDNGNELLDYLRALDPASLADLTGSAGSEVAAAMESFVARLMGTQDRDSLVRAGSDCTAQELARVCFWLMVVGYTLRGLEVRWDMQRTVLAADVRLSCDDSHEAW